MLKHVGRHGDKRVVVIFRQLPAEDHMALVVYPDQLQQTLHDDIMNAVQSTKGQQTKDLADALHGITGTNGETILSTLHNEKWMKKVRTQDIIMIPQPNNPGVRLDEINKIIRDLDTGSDAARQLADLDANAGLADPDKKAKGIEAANKVAERAAAASNSVLSDDDIAKNLLSQADAMKAQMAALEAEVQRLTEEAKELAPGLFPKKRGRKPAKASA